MNHEDFAFTLGELGNHQRITLNAAWRRDGGGGSGQA